LVVPVAAARKLLAIANAVIREGRPRLSTVTAD
jgi:hypothetical protein